MTRLAVMCFFAALMMLAVRRNDALMAALFGCNVGLYGGSLLRRTR